MHPMKRLKTKTHIFVALMVLCGSIGDIFLTKGMRQIGEVSVRSLGSMGTAFLDTVTNGMVWLGIGFMLLYFVWYLLVLSWADYSYVMPASAVGYAVVTFLGQTVLGEHVSVTRWAGVALICIGVTLVGRTPARTSAPLTD